MRQLSKQIIFLLVTFLCASGSLLLSGCLDKDISKANPFMDKWQEKAKTAQPVLPLARLAEEGKSPGNGAGSPAENGLAPVTPPDSALTLRESLPQHKISVRFVGDSLPTVLRTLARLANENILISPNIQGTLDTHIENTPWNTVFMGIINTYGLVVKRENNLLHVMSYQDLEQQLARKSLLAEEEQVAPLVTRMVAIEYSTPAEIATSITLLLGKDKKGQARGSVSVDNHSRALIIRDTQENVDKLLKLIYELDRPTPQILIKAYIVETSKDTARELGVQWGNGVNPTGGKFGDFVLNTSGDFLGDGAILGLMVNGADITLDVQLSALQEDGKLNILSSPSIATLDNNQAVIESGTTIPYPTGQDQNGNTSYSAQEATLKLTVTPHVISNKMIKLDIDAQKDEVDSTRTVGDTPFILKKNANTKLIVQNNSTVVIAGLNKETSNIRNSGVPLLKEIPFFGHLFKKDSDSKTFEDLLIFITPTILNQDM